MREVVRSLICSMLLLLWLAACKPSHSTEKVVPLPPTGRCFSAGVSCKSDGDCGGGGMTQCQEGMCCSGTLSSTSCACLCAGGPPCKSGELCCPGACEDAEDLGVLRCRPHEECFPCGPI